MSKEKSTETQTPAPVVSSNRKKVSLKQVKLSDQPVGFTFEGKYKGLIAGEVFRSIDAKGEIVEKRLQFAIFEKGGERHAFVADKGFIDAITMAEIKEGTEFQFVKLGKEKISKGREMNRYDIYV